MKEGQIMQEAFGRFGDIESKIDHLQVNINESV